MHITIPNFLETGQSTSEYIAVFRFSNWPPPPSWILKSHFRFCGEGQNGLFSLTRSVAVKHRAVRLRNP